MKNIVLVVCTVINIILTAIALIFFFKVDVLRTGPLGDTFGGLLSPVIGGISIYFIYMTFKAQRDQLEDQKKATKSAVDSVYVSELRDFLAEVENRITLIEYVSARGINKNTGLQAIEAFYQTQDARKYGFTSSLIYQDIKLLEDLHYIINMFDFVNVSLFKKDQITNNEIINMFKERFKLSIVANFPTFLNVFVIINEELRFFEKQDLKKLNVDPKQATNVNILLNIKQAHSQE